MLLRFEKGFTEQGFAYISSCKFRQRISSQEASQAKRFLTYRQILKEECGDKLAANNRVARAKALGEGPERGYYLNEENGKYVYLYIETVRREDKYTDKRCHAKPALLCKRFLAEFVWPAHSTVLE